MIPIAGTSYVAQRRRVKSRRIRREGGTNGRIARRRRPGRDRPAPPRPARRSNPVAPRERRRDRRTAGRARRRRVGLGPDASTRRSGPAGSTRGIDPCAGRLARCHRHARIERAPVAARHRPAVLAPEVHQRLVPRAGVSTVDPASGRGVDRRSGRRFVAEPDALHDPSHVHIERGDRRTSRDRRDRRRGVRADAREGPERLDIRRHPPAMVLYHRLRGPREGARRAGCTRAPPMHAARPPGVAARERCHRREPAHERPEHGFDPRRLRLLEHQLRHERPVCARPSTPPRVRPRPGRVPDAARLPAPDREG